MRGLAFPSNAVFDRETSYENGTPASNVGDIPIDPLLGGPAIDPALMSENFQSADVQHFQESQPHFVQPPNQYEQVRQYSQGPQGDPFAFQPPPTYFPIEQAQPVLPSKPLKRKRKPRREEECGFCQGNDGRNKEGHAEIMVTCDECGRSGHPSCMELSNMGDVMRSYPWKCMECKICEICHEKGDDERILFCDYCDRGWHMDCMNPPVEEPPNGRWHCPECPPLASNGEFPQEQSEMPQEDVEQPQPPSSRESSVASSSRSRPTIIQTPKRRGRGKAKPKIAPVPQSGSDIDVEVEEAPRVPRPRGRPKGWRKDPTAHEPDINSTPLASSSKQPKKARIQLQQPQSPAPVPRVRLRLPSTNNKGKEREEDEPPKGLFDDILDPSQRDTSKTMISNADKQHFDRSRVAAEVKLTPNPLPPQPSSSRISEAPETSYVGPSSRPLRSATLQQIPSVPTSLPLSASPGPSTPGGPLLRDTSVLRIRTIRFGQFDIKTWYDAPFPEEYANIPDGRLWICEFCLKYMKSQFGASRHRMKCKARHPPGDEIYRDGHVSIFEVDGRKNKIYCQNLCLLSKMFLDHKSLFYDVEPFLFYVITEIDDFGARFVGYFSKEKRSPKDYNVSCIMTLPVRQRQGWGNLLIDFSYLLSKKERRLGSPEKPLSGLGALGYKNYWTLAVMRYLETAPDRPRLKDICEATSMTVEDVFNILEQQNMISARDPTPPPLRPSPGQSIKYPKGRKNGVARRQSLRPQIKEKDPDGPKEPFIPPSHYEIRWDRAKVEAYIRAWEGKGYLRLKPEKLQWSPYILARESVAEQTNGLEGSSITNGTSHSSTPGTNGHTADSPPLTSNTDEGFKSPDKILVDGLFPESEADTPRRMLRSRSGQMPSQSPSVRAASQNEEPIVTPTRPRPRGRPPKSSLKGDVVLPAQLAQEETPMGRRLRSRNEAAVMSTPRTPQRKRRKIIVASPEMEPVTTPEGKKADMDLGLFSPPGKEKGEDGQPCDGGERGNSLFSEMEGGDEVKFEDAETPLTNLTSGGGGDSSEGGGKDVDVEEMLGDADADGEYEEDVEMVD